MKAVIDTNVLVSGLLNPDRELAKLLRAIGAPGEDRFVPVYDWRIVEEYSRVFAYPKFAAKFAPGAPDALLERIVWLGEDAGNVATYPYSLPDEKDRQFVEVALEAGVPVITSNAKHFPPETGVRIMSAAEAGRWLAAHRISDQ